MPDEKERSEVEQCIHDSIGWALNKDIDRLFSIVARDENFFIFSSRFPQYHCWFFSLQRIGAALLDE